MAELKETARQYYIPDNFIEEGRVFQGRLKLRNLIEGVIMALIFASVGIIIIIVYPQIKLEIKVSIISVLAVPPAIIGIIGFNGDTISQTIKSASAWIKNKDTMLYNTTPKKLMVDPLMTIINQTTARDQILETIEEKRQESIRKKAELNMAEGKDFVFAEDEHVDAYTKRRRKSVAETKGKKTEKEYLINTKVSGKKTGINYNPDQEIDFGNDNEFFSDDIGTVKRYGYRTTEED